MAKGLYGLIYLSSYKVRLDIINMKHLTIVESLDSTSFKNAKNNATLFEEEMPKITSALIGFKDKMKEYKIKRFGFFGNRQFIDSLTAKYIQDQIAVRTGLKITWLNSGQIVYNKLISGMSCFKQVQQQRSKHIPIYLLSLGSVMITLSLFDKNRLVMSWNLPLGPLEIGKINEAKRETPNSQVDVINDFIGARLGHLSRQFKRYADAALIIQHDEALDSNFLNDQTSATRISMKDFQDFYQEIISMPESYAIDKFGLEPAAISHLLPSLITIRQVIEMIGPKEYYVTSRSVITGLIMQEASRKNKIKDHGGELILAMARSLARRYLVDEKHAASAGKFALHIFDRLKKVHLLDSNRRQLLEVAANVSDVGSFVNQEGRYAISAGILKRAPIIGLSDDDLEIVREVVRYQSDKGPIIGSHEYRKINPDLQLTVAKLAAILQVATALDASHKQKIKKIVISLKGNDRLIIHAKTNHDLALERWTLGKRSELFKKIFGIQVILKQEGMNR